MKMQRLLIAFCIACSVAGFPLAGQDQAPQDLEGEELTVSMSQSDLDFDPHHAYSVDEAQTFTALFEGLVTYNPESLDAIPAAAGSWDVSRDGKTYTFHIRENARYWNGDKLTAGHFRDSWLRLLDPSEKAEYASLFDIVVGAEDYRSGALKDVSRVGIRAPNDRDLEVKLIDPALHFLKILSHHSFVPIHPSLMKPAATFTAQTVIGNGPYQIVRKDPALMLLGKNRHYWDAQNVAIPSVRILFENDIERVTDLYNRGRIDWIASAGFDYEKINNKSTLVYNPSFATQYFYFSQVQPALKNTAVRKALTAILPWQEIRKDAAFPADTLVPTIPRYPDVKGIAAITAEEAKKLLADAGFPEGRGLPLIIIAVPSESPSIRQIAEIMVNTWKAQLNVQATIREIPAASYFGSLDTESYTVALLTWIGDFADPLTFLQMWTTTSNLNYAQFSDREYDRLIRLSMNQKEDERYKTLGDAEKILIEGGTVLPISHSPAVNLIDLDIIGGWYPNPLDIHPFKYMKFLEFAPMPGIALR